MNPLFFIFLIIFAGFTVGQLLGRNLPSLIDGVRATAVTIALRVCVPLAVLLSIWQLQTLNLQAAVLPLIGALVLLSGFLISFSLSKVFKMSPLQHATFAPAAGYTNIGAVGALVVTVFLGEAGLALLPLFKIFEELVYYAVLFPFAAKYSPNVSMQRRVWWRDSILLMTSSGLFIGLILNSTGIERPLWMSPITGFIVPIGTFCLMISVGLSFRIGSALKYWKAALALALAKQLILPVIAFGLVFVSGQINAYDGLLLQVTVLLAMMPVALTVMLPAVLYGLDHDLANACWLMSSLVFLCVLPFIPSLLSLVSNS